MALSVLDDKVYTFAGAIFLRAADYCPDAKVEITREEYGLGITIRLGTSETYKYYEFTRIIKLKDPAQAGRSLARLSLSSLLRISGNNKVIEELDK